MRTFPGGEGVEDAARAAALGPIFEQAQRLDEQLQRLTQRRDAPVKRSPFHPTNPGQSVSDRMRMRAAGAHLSGEYNSLAMTALETDPSYASELLQRGLMAAPKGDVSTVKTLCNLGVCCLRTGKANAALRHLQHAIELETPHLPRQVPSSSSSIGGGKDAVKEPPNPYAPPGSTSASGGGLDVLPLAVVVRGWS